MARGKKAADGDEYVAQNGYKYRRVAGKFRLVHHIIAEQKLEREIDTKAERVVFVDGDRTNFDPDNISVLPKSSNSARRVAQIEHRVEELMNEYVDAAENKEEAVTRLTDMVSDLRIELGFSALKP